jgi:hypothetical protein
MSVFLLEEIGLVDVFCLVLAQSRKELQKDFSVIVLSNAVNFSGLEVICEFPTSRREILRG